MGLLSSIKNIAAGGEGKTRNPYQPYSPYIRNYEALQRYDIGRLYGQVPDGKGGFKTGGPRPYEDAGLGYSEKELQGQFGEGRDFNAGEAAGEMQRTADRFRSPGGFGINSAQYARAQQRTDLERVSRSNELKRRMIIENAQQKRADAMARLAAVGAAYGQGVGTYNAYTQGYNERIRGSMANSKALFAAAGAAGGAY